jgi:hypothetical protein
MALAGLAILARVGHATDYGGTMKSVDADKGIVVVINSNGQPMPLRVAEDFKVYDEAGKELPDGIRAKEIKEGVRINFKRVHKKGEEKELIAAIYLGGRQRRMIGDGSPKDAVGLKPLSEMTAQDQYLGEDGGLYGGGQNEPPEAHSGAAKQETSRIAPVDKDGQPAQDGKIVLISISMSNGTQEFSEFKALADADPQKSPHLTIVDCAQGSMVIAAWARPKAKPDPWPVALERLAKAGVSPRQVQIAWIKPANPFPRGDFKEHAEELQEDTLVTLQRAKRQFPNLRLAYLSSRIYAGYGKLGPAGDLNPEPYAYETAFAVRWLIQDQVKGDRELNFDPLRAPVKAPLLLWGPYLWADGSTPRKADGLAWPKQDISSDGIHPSDSGKKKVAQMLLDFFKRDENAKTWFVVAEARLAK